MARSKVARLLEPSGGVGLGCTYEQQPLRLPKTIMFSWHKVRFEHCLGKYDPSPEGSERPYSFGGMAQQSQAPSIVWSSMTVADARATTDVHPGVSCPDRAHATRRSSAKKYELAARTRHAPADDIEVTAAQIQLRLLVGGGDATGYYAGFVSGLDGHSHAST